MTASFPHRALAEVTVNFDAKRRPVKSADRKPGPFPYYGAQGIADHVHDYIFDGEYMLVAEDGENLRSRKEPIALLAKGKFWVNNHAHILQGNKQADTRFLYYAINLADISGYVTGSTIPKLSQSSLNRVMVPCPSLEEQMQIVRLLGSLDDKIELNRRMNETLEAMAQAIFRDWFVDFGPTRRKLEGATDPLTIMGGLVQDTERAQALADLFPTALGDDELPEGWNETTLQSYASLNPESWSPKTAPDQVEYVDLANTKWGTIESTSVYSWEDAPSRARRIVRSGDTIVGTVRPGNGSYAFVGRSGLTASTGFAVLRPKQPVFNELVNCAATSPENIQRLEKLADGGAYPAVKPEVVIATTLPLVPSDVASGFSGFAAPMFAKMESSKEENRTLAATRDLLLPKLMSGEIRLSEAEGLMEAAQ
ncbi:restriction endonuclease subunit S [Rhizobium bangladeshense]|uniref:restriction endonuclease subunit S n=1 Tax=Rhizobium bangladeshense TaxID=1138189 RepID=UPI001A9893CD|nr:restriction endonuclease subunit S [Rhizobium bangladeshense]QSY89509.1 restriction endonuclease subunit S [Rhizobium bangladeshense]